MKDNNTAAIIQILEDDEIGGVVVHAGSHSHLVCSGKKKMIGNSNELTPGLLRRRDNNNESSSSNNNNNTFRRSLRPIKGGEDGHGWIKKVQHLDGKAATAATAKTVSFQEMEQQQQESVSNTTNAIDKENSNENHASVNSFRRALRSTVSPPPPSVGTNSTTTRPCKSTPFAVTMTSRQPAHAVLDHAVLDMSSTALLARELEMDDDDDDDVDDSLLISPPPTAAASPVVVAYQKPVGLQQQNAVQPSQQQQQPQQQQQQHHHHVGLLKRRSLLGGPRLSGKPQIVRHNHHPTNDTDDDDDSNSDSLSCSSTVPTKKPPPGTGTTAAALAHTAIASATTLHNPQQQQQQLCLLSVHGGGGEHVDHGDYYDYAYGPARLTPLGAVGVCMDLSNMFQNVQSTCRKKKPDDCNQQQQQQQHNHLEQRLLSSVPRRLQAAAMAPTTTISSTKQGSIVKLPPMSSASIRTWKTNGTVRSNNPTPSTTARLFLTDSRKKGEPQSSSSSSVDNWAEQQCLVFTEWLNYTIHPNNEDQDYDAAVQEVGQHKIALRTLLLHQRMAKARYQASQVWQGQEMCNIRQVLVKQIDSGRIQIRKDRNMYADLTLRKQILNLLFSYSTPWLRLGLETMFHVEILPETPHQFSPPRQNNNNNQNSNVLKVGDRPKTNLSRMQLAIKNFVIQRVLSDEPLLAKYTKGLCKVPSGRFEQKYQAELRALVLSRLLVLFFFLDRAKQDNILDKSPRLFANDSAVKSSKEVLLAFCRDFLSAEGDFVKHLSRVGLKVGYEQHPIDELDFCVTNLAIDLRDGSRLARMLEVLTNAPFKSILERLRLPAVSRLQKLRNVGIVLDLLRTQHDVPLIHEIAAHHVVDGHRERVLKFLWAVVAHFCIQRLLHTDMIEQEIGRIRHSRHGRRGLSYAETGLASPDAGDDDDDDGETITSKEERLKLLLLRWVCEICSAFGVFVSNLSSDFADGIATCLVIHYYHPTMLRISEIQPTSRRTRFLAPCRADVDAETIYSHERKNCELARNRMSLLGGMANMIPISDSVQLPDDRVMLLCLAFLFSRLLESSHEIRKAHVIQSFIRFRLHKVWRKRKLQAAKTIVQAWKSNKENYYRNQRAMYSTAVSIIEAFVAKNRNRLVEMRRDRHWMEQGATVLQKYARRWISQKLVSHRRRERAVIMFQCWWRRTIAMQKYHSARLQCMAAMIIQFRWRCYHARLVLEYHAAVRIQTLWRRRYCEIMYTIDWLDITTVQSCARRWIAIQARNDRLLALRCMQVAIKGYLLRKRIVQAQIRRLRNTAAVALQCAWRQRQATNHVNQELYKYRSSKRIQSVWRGFRSRSGLAEKTQACKKVQALFRGATMRESYLQLRCSSIKIQTFWRCKFQRHEYISELAKVLCCQTVSRRWLAKNEAEIRYQCIILIQSAARVCLSRRKLATARAVHHKRVTSSVTIQRCWRRANTHHKFTMILSHIVLAQSVVRRVLASIQTRKLQSAILSIQRIARAWLARRRVALLKEWKRERQDLEIAAIITIQRYWRGASALFEFKLVVHDAIVVQSHIRRFLASRRSEQMWYAMLFLQNVTRVWLAKRHVALVRAQHNAAAVQVQCAYRGYVLRREMFYTNICATHIQRVFRGYIIRRSFQNALLCIVQTQSVGRMYFARRLARKRYISLVRIQACARRHVVAKQMINLHACTVTVQRVIRGHSARRSAKAMLRDIVVVQSIARIWISARIAHERLNAILYIQASTRRHLVIRRMANQQVSTQLIQRVFRGHSARLSVKAMMRDVIITQSLVRVWLSRQLARQRSWSIVCIQSTFRRHLALQKATALQILKCERIAAVKLQCFVRCVAAMKFKNLLAMAKKDYQDRVLAAAIIQITVRTYLTRKYAATRIQKTWRCYTVHIDFMLAILLTIKIQQFARRLSCQNLRKRMEAAVLKMQRFARLTVRRIRLRRRQQAAIAIQSIVRMHRRRSQYKIQQASAVAMQRWTRGHLTRSTLEIEHFAATEIQRVWRGYDQFAEYACALLDIIVIQCAVRNFLAAKVVETLKIHRNAEIFRRHRCARLIQRRFRWYVDQVRLSRAASVVQRAERARQTKKAFHSLKNSIIRIQSLRRGRIVRLKQPKKIACVVIRIKEAGKKAQVDPSLRLDNRTKAALHVLRTSKRLVEIMNAVCTLEMATRFSKACCIAFSQAGATMVLFDLIRTCNRSLPHVQLLHMILQTMSNVSNYQELLPHVATRSGVGVFLDLVQMFRDQEHVFSLAVSLLERVILCSRDFQALCSTPENLKRLKGVYTLCVRKLSIAGPSRTPLVYSTNRVSAESRLPTPKSQRHHGNPDLQQGVHTLERVIRLVDTE